MDPADLDALAALAAETEFRDWLAGIKNDVGIDEIVAVVGSDLLSSRVLNAAEFGSPPNSLQVAKLTRRMRASGVHGCGVGPDWLEYGWNMVGLVQLPLNVCYIRIFHLLFYALLFLCQPCQPFHPKT